jgi:hypothetical protein
MKDEKFELTIDSPTASEQRGPYGEDVYNRAPSRASARWPASVNEAKLVRKIDWSIIPILMAAYFLQFLDKVIYNVCDDNPSGLIENKLTHLPIGSTRMSWACRKTWE